MAKTKKTNSAKKIIDVKHPDQTTPSDNSKSVIVNSRKLLVKDPMMLEDNPPANDAAPAQEPAPKSPSSSKPKLKPIAEPGEAGSQPEPAPKTEDLKVPDLPSAGEPAPAQPETKPAKEDEAAGGEAEPQEAKKPLAEDKIDKNKSETDDAQRAQHQAQVKKLLDSKKYVLPINAVEKRRSKRFVLLGVLLSLLLALAWFYVALDAGLIQNSRVQPITDFFPN